MWIAVAVLMAGGACSDDNGPTDAAEKALAFTLAAPSSVPTKQSVDIEIRVTQAVLVNYPLTVTFEEANADEPYALVATKMLLKPEDTTESISEEAARDPLYRVTICEAGQAAKLCVAKTALVDVLDFP
jgi:hypothetical protein